MNATMNVGVKVAVKWTAKVWEAFECPPCLYGVYAMGPDADMDSPDGCLLGVYGHVGDADDAAWEAAEGGMWPDNGYRVEVRNYPKPCGWDSREGERVKLGTSVADWEAGPF
jgi:hypothetical protein